MATISSIVSAISENPQDQPPNKRMRSMLNLQKLAASFVQMNFNTINDTKDITPIVNNSEFARNFVDLLHYNISNTVVITEALLLLKLAIDPEWNNEFSNTKSLLAAAGISAFLVSVVDNNIKDTNLTKVVCSLVGKMAEDDHSKQELNSLSATSTILKVLSLCILFNDDTCCEEAIRASVILAQDNTARTRQVLLCLHNLMAHFKLSSEVYCHSFWAISMLLKKCADKVISSDILLALTYHSNDCRIATFACEVVVKLLDCNWNLIIHNSEISQAIILVLHYHMNDEEIVINALKYISHADVSKDIDSRPGAIPILLNVLYCHGKNAAIFKLISNLIRVCATDISEKLRLQFVRALSNDLSDKVVNCGLKTVNLLINNWTISNSEFCTLVPVLLNHANNSTVC